MRLKMTSGHSKIGSDWMSKKKMKYLGLLGSPNNPEEGSATAVEPPSELLHLLRIERRHAAKGHVDYGPRLLGLEPRGDIRQVEIEKMEPIIGVIIHPFVQVN